MKQLTITLLLIASVVAATMPTGAAIPDILMTPTPTPTTTTTATPAAAAAFRGTTTTSAPMPTDAASFLSSAASAAMDTSTADTASISSSTSAGTTTASYAMMSAMPAQTSPPSTTTSSSYYSSSSGSNAFSYANNAWSYLQNLGGSCCNNCTRFCGLAIKLANTSYYLTNKNSWLEFDYTYPGSPASNQIFTIGQNADCTWYISNGGKYLSMISTFSGQWIGLSSTLGFNERWYIERNGAYVYVQSAASQYYYWTTSGYPWYVLGYKWATAQRFTFEYFPCDKNFGWNW